MSQLQKILKKGEIFILWRNRYPIVASSNMSHWEGDFRCLYIATFWQKRSVRNCDFTVQISLFNNRSALLPNTVLSSLELLLLLPWGLCRTEAAEATVAWGCWGCWSPLLPGQPLLPKLPELTSELLQPDGELLLGTDELQSPELILCPSEVISRLLQPPSRLSEILE